MAARKASNSRAFTIALGAKVKDIVTGFGGVVTGQVRYISGCNQYYVVPSMKTSKENKMPSGEWLDEERLSVLRGGVNLAATPSGGPQPTPVRATPPKR